MDSVRKVTKPSIGVAKALISIQGKPVVEHLINKIRQAGLPIENIFIATNQAFYSLFENWAKISVFPLNNLINNGTELNKPSADGRKKGRLGGNRDLALAINQSQIDDDLLVIAGDTLFNFDLRELLQVASQISYDLMAYYQEKWEMMQERGMLIFDQNEMLVDFVEKSQNPTSNYANPSIYLFKKSTLPLLQEFLKPNPPLKISDGCGFFIQWLIKELKHPIKGFKIDGRFDLGTLADCERASQEFIP